MKVATLRPTALLRLYGREDLQAVAQEVETIVLRITDAACG